MAKDKDDEQEHQPEHTKPDEGGEAAEPELEKDEQGRTVVRGAGADKPKK